VFLSQAATKCIVKEWTASIVMGRCQYLKSVSIWGYFGGFFKVGLVFRIGISSPFVDGIVSSGLLRAKADLQMPVGKGGALGVYTHPKICKM